jgi:hypothetical protein
LERNVKRYMYLYIFCYSFLLIQWEKMERTNLINNFTLPLSDGRALLRCLRSKYIHFGLCCNGINFFRNKTDNEGWEIEANAKK